MAVKVLTIPDIGDVSFYKRRGLKSIRLSVRADGKVRVSLPPYVPYQAAVAFVRSKQRWLAEHTTPSAQPLQNAQAIGMRHTLRLQASFTADKVAAKSGHDDIIVTFPAHMTETHPDVQTAAERAAVRALRNEAEALLPGRVAEIADRTGFTYKSVVVKKLRSRWGSCDQDHTIVLNLYLMQLPWELIDYVIVHELVHTRLLHHGETFWEEFLHHEPRAKELRRRMRQYQPNLLLPPRR